MSTRVSIRRGDKIATYELAAVNIQLRHGNTRTVQFFRRVGGKPAPAGFTVIENPRNGVDEKTQATLARAYVQLLDYTPDRAATTVSALMRQIEPLSPAGEEARRQQLHRTLEED